MFYGVKGLIPTFLFVLAASILSGCGDRGSDSDSGIGSANTVTVYANLLLGVGGSLSFSSRDVVVGQTTVLTVTPDTGYEVDRVEGCGGALIGDTFTTDVVNAECEINVAFRYVAGVVEPLYANAVNWMDYVRASNTSIAADGTEAGGYDAVMHGGELKSFLLPNISSCGGSLSIVDSVNAFNWSCKVEGNNLRITSTGLAQGKYLSDLIDFAGTQWKNMRLYVGFGDYTIAQTALANWWTNPVVDGNAGVNATDVVNDVGKIYVVTTNPDTSLILSASKTAIVIQPGVTLSLTGDNAAVDLIFLEDGPFQWLEGTIDATGEQSAISSSLTKFTNIQNVDIVGSGIVADGGTDNYKDISIANIAGSSYAFELFAITDSSFSNILIQNVFNGIYAGSGSTGLNFNELKISEVGNQGVWLRGATNSVFDGVRIDVTKGEAIAISNSANNNRFRQLMLSSCGGTLADQCINIDQSNDNIFSDITSISATHSASAVINTFTTSGNIFSRISIVSSASIPINEVTSNKQTYNNLALVNNNSVGFYLADVTNVQTRDLHVTDQEIEGLEMAAVNDTSFHGQLQLGNSSCVVDGINPGIDSTCGAIGDSTHTLTSGLSALDSFVGVVTTDDVSNSSDTDGTATYPSTPGTFDFSNFDNLYRGWSIDDGNNTITATQRGAWTTGAGHIVDLSLKSTDTVLKDKLALPDGNMTATHTFSDLTSVTYLVHAVEIPNQANGNNNLLCESNETCLYTPNLGSYQGHGAIIDAVQLGDTGTIKNVKLMKYEINGY